MFDRLLKTNLQETLGIFPAVALLGPRQAGKTTLAHQIAAEHPGSLYLDLESERDRAQLAQPELFLEKHLGRLVILDEIHRIPNLFPILRGQIDRARRHGYKAGQYLLLGSGSPELLRQSGESLAGRIAYLNLSALNVLEVGDTDLETLWTRGGFPDSLLAHDDHHSREWRDHFITTYLERDIPQMGVRIAASSLRRLWGLLAYQQGAQLNMANLARTMGLDVKTIHRYVGLLEDLMLVRVLQPWSANLGKRLTRTPKVFVRDSGILHALLGLENFNALIAHPVMGQSWEGFVTENILSCAPTNSQSWFYRTTGGAEVDLMIQWPDQKIWAIEIKHGLMPRPSKGFYAACDDIKADQRWVVYSGESNFPVATGVTALPLAQMCQAVREYA